MDLASIIRQYYDPLIAKYWDTLLPGHLKALDAIGRCRTPESGEVFVQCSQSGQFATASHLLRTP